MNEKLLQFIWDRQLFNASLLQTTAQEAVEVLETGRWNHDQGPDFLGARVRIGGHLLAGHVEIHVNSSEWRRHKHHLDENYNNVVLHVVWACDEEVSPSLPVLELQPLVPSFVLNTYQQWMWSRQLIPCREQLSRMDPERIVPFIDAMAEARFRQRAQKVLENLRMVGMDWQQAFWQDLARCFGQRVNAESFERIAASIPYNIMLKLRGQVMQLEALLLGQAGLLRPDNGDAYAKLLFREYGFLRNKHGLAKSYAPVHFLRMRPVNFPTVRLAQLAMLIHKVPDLFRMVKDSDDLLSIKDMLRVTASEYWDTHYRFQEPSPLQKKTVGEQLAISVITNVIIPFSMAYHLHLGNHHRANEVVDWLKHLPPENNAIIRGFGLAGLTVRQSKDVQGLLQLHKQFCAQSRCAECSLGKMMLAEREKELIVTQGNFS